MENQKFVITNCNMNDFQKFSATQLDVLPDVQKINEIQFTNLINENEIIMCKDDTEEEIAGFAIVKDAGSHGLLRQLAVANNYRRRGVASLLVSACLDWFEEHCLKDIHIFVKKENTAALSLYKKFGFSISFERHQFIINWHSFLEYYGKLNVKPINLKLIFLKPDYDEIIHQKFGVSLKELKLFRETDSSLNIGIFIKNEIQGFTRLRPKFPVLTPLYLENENYIINVIKQIKELCNPTYDYLKITIEDGSQIRIIQQQEWSKLNFILVKMYKSYKN